MSQCVLNIADAHYVDLAELSRQMERTARRALRRLHRAAGAAARRAQAGLQRHRGGPGKRAFPFHSHRANEEMFFIIEGTGEVRIGSEVRTIRPGDVIACPSAGPQGAHQIVNTGKTELKVLAVSTMITPEVCHYPDSGKVAILDSGADGFRYVGRKDSPVDYWEGE